ncbi:MAG: hypothetical protein AB2693_28835 [Candidatus Thiodiazotropha sp.]
MSAAEKTPKSKSESKKKRKSKRQASSPLFASGHVNGVNTSERISEQRKKCKSDKSDNNSETVSAFLSNLNFVYDPNMTFQPQGTQFGMPQQQPYIQSPPPNQFGFGLQAPTAPPPWATKLLEDMEQIKQKLQGMDKIEKTVNLINAKVSDLETKMKSLDTRLIANEKSCEFISSVNEQNKTELKATKDELSEMTKSCKQLEKETSSMKEKLVDLESRSMRENLMFYGIPEAGRDENCEELVKHVCKDTLKLQNADQMIFDRAHRIGAKTGPRPRPIVVKFHYYHEREMVRKRSFDYSDTLKAGNMGIGAQLPKETRDARKQHYPTMKRAKSEGKQVKFVGSKLYIDGVEHVQAGQGPPPMDH